MRVVPVNRMSIHWGFWGVWFGEEEPGGSEKEDFWRDWEGLKDLLFC